MREESDTRDAAIAQIAARQHGVVSASQLHEMGIDKSAISRRVRNGASTASTAASTPSATAA